MAHDKPKMTQTSSPVQQEGAHHTEQAGINDMETEHPQHEGTRSMEKLGSEEDQEREPPWTYKRIMSFVSLAFLWTGSQIPGYLLGSIPPRIYRDIGGVDRWTWFVLAHALTLASICPFVGSLSDLFGRRYVALLGSIFLIIGMIICGTAQIMNQFIAGIAVSGAGAGICELTCLAGTSELAPARKRGFYVAVLVFTIVPFVPSALYAQLIAGYGSWRWCCLLAGIWAAVGAVGTILFYFPPPRPNSLGRTKRQIVAEIDFVGAFLSITGIVLFVAGMEWGGYQYPWSSAQVLCPLIIGFCLLFIAFPIWEIKFAKYPMFPSRMRQEMRIFALTLIITAISGANFFSILMFWPTQSFNVYGHSPLGNGIRTLPVGFSILTGCLICLVLLSVLKGHIREIILGASVLMTAGCGAMAVADLNNLHTVYGLLFLAGLGIGGIVVPASIITTIICPDDIIATVTALTLTIRVIGGCIGYVIYYNTFVNKFKVKVVLYIEAVMVYELGITDAKEITAALDYTASSLTENIQNLPSVQGNVKAYEMIVSAGQLAFSESYRYVYLVSIAFGSVAVICSLFLGHIHKYMDDHVAVDIH